MKKLALVSYDQTTKINVKYNKVFNLGKKKKLSKN